MSHEYRLSMDTIARVVELLRTTDISVENMSERMGISRKQIIRINSKYKVRIYQSHTKWTTNGEFVDAGICTNK